MKLKKRITFLKKSDKAKKEDNFFRDKLLIPIGATVIAGFIASYLSNYLTKQASYNDLVDKYTARLKEIVVSDKLNSLRFETGELKTDIAYLVNKKTEDTIDLDKLKTSRKTLIDEFLLPKNTDSNEPEPEKIQIESILKFIQNRSAQKDKELAQIRGLMNTITVNTLISLSEDDAFIPGFSGTFLSFIPFFKSRNVERRDIIINALRLSELGIGNRIDGDATFPFFLENTKIGGYSLQTGAVIDLKKMDLTIGYLNGSTFTQVNLDGANFNRAHLNPSTFSPSIFSESRLNNVKFAATEMENVRFINSSVQNSTFDDSSLKGIRTISEKSNRICARLFLGITLTSKGRKCNTVDFSGSSFLNSDLSDSQLTNSILVEVNLTNANLTNADLTNADLTNANLTNTNLTNTNLTNANLSGVKGFKLDKQETLKDILIKMADQNNIRLCNTSSSYDERNDTNAIVVGWFQMLFGFKNNDSFVLFNDCKNANLSNKTVNLQEENDISSISWKGANMTNAIIQTNLNEKLDKNKQIDQQLKKIFEGAKFCNTLFLLNSQTTSYGFGPRISNNCEGENLSNKNLSGSFWTKVDLTNANLENSILDIKSRADAKLCNTILPNGIKSFKNCKEADLSKQRLNEKLSVKGLNLKGADFTGANLSYVDLSGANLANTKLIEADLTNTKLIEADLTNANLEKSILDSKSLAKVKNLCNTILPDGNKSFEKCQGADLTKADLTKADLTKADLTKADLTKADLSGANLTSANLENSILDMESLNKVKKLCNTILPDGSKSFKKCQDADLTKTDLTKADLSGANLTSANLENSILDMKSLNKVKNLCNTILPDGSKSFKKCQDADLTKADLTNADLTKADLSTVKGLELQQLEKAILCHTKLPAKLAAQNIENRDCPKK
jgi:uncharacterized protein YjbI with pentapeptide repeats